ncbi:hypothetical protein [Billgrantia kenyensis]|uniref:DUF2459 domain-containing protein n=1 Tax=Billgrantia kenyensis TaxID=321266 RepID=A0A7V9VYJ9_9GAMM|nr:hypothetical protein [Halomonas kenyensis]MBA2777677.1 hypothetical protein [Halomonas kenyensis]MCG6660347.1 hypothetical protein [Halomonas kenyensis]
MTLHRDLSRGLGIAVFALLLTGCVGRVAAPEPAALAQPVEVFLLDHGRHASLVLPGESSGVVRYSYGEWRWYVEGERHFLAGVSAMLWPTEAGLGRGVHPEIDHPREFSRLAPEGLVAVYPLHAEAARVGALRSRLDAHFEDSRGEPVASDEFGLEFVPYPRRYSALHQSNLIVAHWLRDLDVEISGSPWLSNWRIDAP